MGRTAAAAVLALLTVACSEPPAEPAAAPEHAVILRLPLSDDDVGTGEDREAVRALAVKMKKAVEAANAGEYDGDEFGGGIAKLYFYGPDADALYEAIEPLLMAFPGVKGGSAMLRRGEVDDPNAKTTRVDF